MTTPTTTINLRNVSERTRRWLSIAADRRGWTVPQYVRYELDKLARRLERQAQKASQP